MGYVYAVMWLTICIFLVFLGFRVHKMLWVGSGMFLIWSVWQLINELVKEDLYSGVYEWIFRCITSVFLLTGLIWYLSIRRKLYK